MSNQTMTLILTFRSDGTYQAVYCKHFSTLKADDYRGNVHES